MEQTGRTGGVRILVSACLLGEAVRYDGTAAPWRSPVLDQWRKEGRVLALCPEVTGGSSIPRPPCEIVGGDGYSVLDGRAVVMTPDGRDLTKEYLDGAEAALATALSAGAWAAVLKDGSPSCGTGRIHDGTFSGRLRQGRGVTAALLERNGVRTFSERDLELAAQFLDNLGTR